MPCYLLELLSSGRPMGAIRLKQYDPLVEAGVSGFLVERPEDRGQAAEQMAEGFRELAEAIAGRRLDPQAIRAHPEVQAVYLGTGKTFERKADHG